MRFTFLPHKQMPVRRTRTTRRTRRTRRYTRRARPSRALRTNPRPVFTETYLGPQLAPNSGGVFKFNISSLPQISQYNNLYQKYRILKAQVILVPQYDGADQNAASYNAGTGIFAHGMGRFVFAINDSPALVAPGSEAAVLQDNGAKIRAVRTMIKMSCRPVPIFEDAHGIVMTLKKNWLNFQIPPAPSDPDHFGITWWYSQPALGATALANNVLHSYVKLTFQLADPR